MKNIIVLLITIIISGCSSLQMQYTTLNTAGQIDSIYGDVEIIQTEADIRRKLARDFRFRYDLQTYWNRQPYSLVSQYYWSLSRGWRYGFNSPWQMYNSYDWFNYPFDYGWNSFGWNNWNNWNGWGYSYYNSPFIASNNWYNGPFNNRGYNVVYNASRRTSEISIENRIANLQDTNKRRVKPNVTPIVTIPDSNNKPVIKPNSRINNNNTIRINNNNRPSYNNVRPPVNNNQPTININSRPSINRSTTTRNSRPTPSKRGGN